MGELMHIKANLHKHQQQRREFPCTGYSEYLKLVITPRWTNSLPKTLGGRKTKGARYKKMGEFPESR